MPQALSVPRTLRYAVIDVGNKSNPEKYQNDLDRLKAACKEIIYRANICVTGGVTYIYKNLQDAENYLSNKNGSQLNIIEFYPLANKVVAIDGPYKDAIESESVAKFLIYTTSKTTNAKNIAAGKATIIQNPNFNQQYQLNHQEALANNASAFKPA